MSSSRTEQLYLEDILEAAESVERFVEGIPQDVFLRSDLIRSAVLHKLTVIGEAVARLPTEFRERHPEIEWRDIIGFRNFAVHAYFAVDWNIVWTTATGDIPRLKPRIREVLRIEFPTE